MFIKKILKNADFMATKDHATFNLKIKNFDVENNSNRHLHLKYGCDVRLGVWFAPIRDLFYM